MPGMTEGHKDVKYTRGLYYIPPGMTDMIHTPSFRTRYPRDPESTGQASENVGMTTLLDPQLWTILWRINGSFAPLKEWFPPEWVLTFGCQFPVMPRAS